MIDNEQRLEEALESVELLDKSDDAMRRAFLDRARIVTLPENHFVCMEGDQCGVLPIVLSGQARVFKSSSEGREITLYRIDPGECCILTASCIIGDRAFPAFAQAESNVEAVVIQTADFRDWFGRFEPWRSYVFTMVLRRLSTVIEYVEEIAFKRLDERLASYLIEHSVAGPSIQRTHEQIAADLGSSRETVSRSLKDLEHEKIVELGRGTIRIAAEEALRRRAERG